MALVWTELREGTTGLYSGKRKEVGDHPSGRLTLLARILPASSTQPDYATNYGGTARPRPHVSDAPLGTPGHQD
jgi:hypothetical protein